MEGIPNKALEFLGPFPILQGALALLIILVGLYVALRAVKDRSPPEKATPIQIESPWLVQHLVEMHLIIDQIDENVKTIKRKIGAD